MICGKGKNQEPCEAQLNYFRSKLKIQRNIPLKDMNVLDMSLDMPVLQNQKHIMSIYDTSLGTSSSENILSSFSRFLYTKLSETLYTKSGNKV